MEKKHEQIHSDQWLKDLPVQSEAEGFKPEEMILCEKCRRKSPPTRLKCFYCGAVLNISAKQNQYLKPTFRKLEDWEKGFNLIYLPQDENINPDIQRKMARLVNFETDAMQKFLETKKPLPLARLESQTEAEVIGKRLEEIEIKCKIVSDEELKPETFPKRLRGIEFFEDKIILILFNADEIAEIELSEVQSIIVGALFERKIEATESIKKKDDRKILDSSEISSDEMLIDIYCQNDIFGYRIEPKGFDFSCLGAEKSLLAKDNIKTLVEKLRSIAPKAKFDNDYVRIRAEISRVWEVTQRNDSSGVQRQGLGKFKRTNTLTINNLTQFTRYSRLQRYL